MSTDNDSPTPKAAPSRHLSEPAFRRTMQGQSEYFDVYCPSCERQLDPIPDQYKTYFRRCPNKSCGRYFRVRIDGDNEATLIPARRYDRTGDGVYVSEDGAEIHKSPNRAGADKWVGEHPEMEGSVVADTLREAREAIDRKV